ncbi:MAG: transcription-repair coupling factor, partial [Prevotellaceae bacterium]|nr:transcription-repair coupling factor [Prevotellaceae bacterium]
MTINELQCVYTAHPNSTALRDLLHNKEIRHIYCQGLQLSASALFFSSFVSSAQHPYVFVLSDLEEAGYYYHDFAQLLGTDNVLFFPSSFRRAAKYGQKDTANEILRTEVLGRLRTATEP